MIKWDQPYGEILTTGVRKARFVQNHKLYNDAGFEVDEDGKVIEQGSKDDSSAKDGAPIEESPRNEDQTPPVIDQESSQPPPPMDDKEAQDDVDPGRTPRQRKSKN